MNKLFIALSTAAVIGFTSVAVAGDQNTMTGDMPTPGKPGEIGKAMDHTGPMHKDGKWMEGMDANNDGMVTREEYTTHYGMKYDKMNKNAEGSVDMKEFGMMEGGRDRPMSSSDSAKY